MYSCIIIKIITADLELEKYDEFDEDDLQKQLEEEDKSFEQIEEKSEKAIKTWQRLRKKYLLDKVMDKRKDKEKRLKYSTP